MLIGNGLLMHRQCATPIGGAVAHDRVAWNRWTDRNRFLGSPAFGAMPGTGYLPGAAWVMPQTSGAISSNKACQFLVSLPAATIAAGRNLEGNVQFSLSIPDAQMQLIVSASGNMSFSMALGGQVSGVVWGSGSLDFSLDIPTTTLGAIAGMFGNCLMQVSCSGTIRAIGHLEGHMLPYTELSPQNLAAAVWNAAASAYQVSGTMGAKMNQQAGSNPTAEEIAERILDTEGITPNAGDYVSLRQAMRLVIAYVAGNSDGGPNAPRFKNLDGDKVVLGGTADQNGNRVRTHLDLE